MRQIIDEAVERVTRLPRHIWDVEIQREAEAFYGRAQDEFLTAMMNAQLRHSQENRRVYGPIPDDPDRDSSPSDSSNSDQQGGLGLGNSFSERMGRVVIQGQVRDPDPTAVEIMMGQPVNTPPSPTTTMTTDFEFERISIAGDPWYDAPAL